MAANAQIPGYAKTLMAIAAIFMPVFLVLPFFFWGNEANDIALGEESIQRGRLAPVGRLNLAADPAAAAADTGSTAAFNPENTYNSVCAACHATGLLNAPKFGEAAPWQAKITERGGIDALIKQGIQGIGGMPAKGGAAVSDDDFATTVKYMLANSGIEVDYQAPAAAEPAKAEETPKAEAAPAEPAKAEEAPKTESAPTEPAKAEEAPKSDSASAEPAKTEEAPKAEAAPAEPAKTEETPKAEAAPAESAKAEQAAAGASAYAPVPGFDAANTYKSVCAACHATGLLGAVKIGDTAQWEAKISLRGGLDGVIAQGITGVNAMPPKGGAFVNDNEFAEVVRYMAKESGINTGN